MSNLTNQQIAGIILEQLGGNKFKAMTGAKNFMHGSGDDHTLYFQIPRANRITHVSITLEPGDTYRMIFSRLRKLSRVIEYTAANVYADQLRSIFTEQTGLETSL